MDDESQNQGSESRSSTIASGAFIAIGVVILQDFISLRSLDIPAYISVIAFAVAIPILALHILTFYDRNSNKPPLAIPRYEIPYTVFGFFTAMVGIDAAFWHVHWIVGVVFLISLIIALALYIFVNPPSKLV